jgi:hypothetical protein
MTSPPNALGVADEQNADINTNIVTVMGSGLSNGSNKCDVDAFLQIIHDIVAFPILILLSERGGGVAYLAWNILCQIVRGHMRCPLALYDLSRLNIGRCKDWCGFGIPLVAAACVEGPDALTNTVLNEHIGVPARTLHGDDFAAAAACEVLATAEEANVRAAATGHSCDMTVSQLSKPPAGQRTQ